MTDLGKMFEEMADSSGPPSRASADLLYTAGRRRYRRRRNALTGGAAALVVAAVATVTATGLRANQVVTPPTPGEQGATVRPYPTGKVQWAVAADSNHLFVGASTCQPPQCAKGTVQVLGSDDGGRTWRDRGSPINAVSVVTFGSQTLTATVGAGTATPDGGTASAATLMISRDAARTWEPVAAGAPVSRVPAGGRIICAVGAEEDGQACEPTVVDPNTGRSAVLANPPALTVRANRGQAVDTVGPDGLIWIAGHDPATRRPAVSWSRDAGRNWSTHVFTDYDCGSHPQCGEVTLTTVDGSTVYAVLTGGPRRSVHRGTAEGTWRELDASMVTYYPDRAFVSSFVTGDGTHVLGELRPGSEQSGGGVADLDTYQFWAAEADATAYRKVALDGLPAAVADIKRTADGWYYTTDYPARALYGSTDGLHWSRVAGTR